MKALERCAFCGSRRLVARRVVRSFGQRLDKLVIVGNVPVVVCRDCGEGFIKGETLKRLHALAQNRDKLRKTPIPIGRL